MKPNLILIIKLLVTLKSRTSRGIISKMNVANEKQELKTFVSEFIRTCTFREAVICFNLVINIIALIFASSLSTYDSGATGTANVALMVTIGSAFILSDYIQHSSKNSIGMFGNTGVLIVSASLFSTLILLIQTIIEVSRCSRISRNIRSLYRECQEEKAMSCIVLDSEDLVGIGNKVCGNLGSDSYETLQAFRIIFILLTSAANMYVVYKSRYYKIHQESISALMPTTGDSSLTPREETLHVKDVIGRLTLVLLVYEIIRVSITSVSPFASFPINTFISHGFLLCFVVLSLQTNLYVNDTMPGINLKMAMRLITTLLSIHALLMALIALISVIAELSQCSDNDVYATQLRNCQNTQYSDFACVSLIHDKIAGAATGLCYNIIVSPVLGKLWIACAFLTSILILITANGCLDRASGWSTSFQIILELFRQSRTKLNLD